MKMGNDIIQPKVSLSIVSADQAVTNAPQSVLLVGIKNDAGTAGSASLVENIANDGSENTLFGIDSQIASAVRAFKAISPNVRLDAIPLNANAGGTAAVFTISFAGTASESGNVVVNVGSKSNNKVTVAIASGDTATTVATNVANAISFLTKKMYAPSSSVGVVTLTCIHKGTSGNWGPINAVLNGKFSGQLSGLTVTIANTVVGATDPTAANSTSIFDVIGTRRYQGVVWLANTNNAIPSAWLDSRFNVNNRVLDGVAFCHVTDSWVNALVAVGTSNSKSLVLFCDKQNNISGYYGASNQEPPHITLASFAALRALRLTEGAAITQYLTTTAARDQFGGTALASLPYFNSTIPTLSVPYPNAGFTDTEITQLEAQGGSVIGQNSNGTNPLVGAVHTTYKTDPAGNPDISFKYLNYVDTMSAVREYFVNNYKKRYGQSRLTEGDVQYGRDMVNKALFEGYTDRLYGDLSGPDFVLCQDGEDAIIFFKKNRIVTLDLATGTINVNMLVPIVTQVRNIIGTVKIAFTVEG
jgi:phage tail sheath gpL-like